jgi:hypothetical protein
MDVTRMFEDLEASVNAGGIEVSDPKDAFRQAASVTVTLGNRVMRLQRLVFARDFLLGQHHSLTFVVNFRTMGAVRLHAAGQVSSKQSKALLHGWLRELPAGLQFSVVLANGERISKVLILSCDKTFIVLRPSDSELEPRAVPLSAIVCFEFNAVDNKLGI